MARILSARRWARPGPRWLPVLLVSLGALLAGSLLPSCLYPIRQDDECTRRVSECLGDCRDDPGRDRATATDFHLGTDTRTACERRCDALCE